MKVKEKAGAPVVLANVTIWEMGLHALDEAIKTDFTRTQLTFLGIAAAGATQAFVAYGIPLLKIVYGGAKKRLMTWAGILAVLLVASTTEASPARLVAECAKTDQKLSASTNQLEEVCVRPRVYFDIGVQFGGIAFNLVRPRNVLAGFQAGTGYGFRWLPDFWTLSDAFLSVDLFVTGGFAANEGAPDAVLVGVSGMITFMNIVGGGFGYQWSLGLGEAPDTRVPIGLLGAVSSF